MRTKGARTRWEAPTCFDAGYKRLSTGKAGERYIYMKKLFNADIIDIFPTESGFIYSCKEIIDGSKEAVAFFEYSKTVDIFKKLTVNEYVEGKYGEENYACARALGDFVSCRIIPLSSGKALASYPNGTIKVYDINGKITDTMKVTYKGYSACYPAAYKGELWMAVPEANAVVNYSIKFRRIEFRVGNSDERTFSHPTDMESYDGQLYVCNRNSFSIKILNPESYAVNNYKTFGEPVTRYFRDNDSEYVLLKSGVYML